MTLMKGHTATRLFVQMEERVRPAGCVGVSVLHSSTFDQDLGVFDEATGAPCIHIRKYAKLRVGQYKVTEDGVYKFDDGDTGPKRITYAYRHDVMVLRNPPMAMARATRRRKAQ